MSDGLAPLAVLIVDDVAEMTEMMKGILEPLVRKLTVASNRPELLRELSKRRPDLVLLDEIIPGESLEDLLEEVRASGCRVILLTSLANREKVPLPPGVLCRVMKPEWKAVARFVSDLKKGLATELLL